ncbi:hypothetical protein [Cryobacterium cheniae]|uniref:hypothetical protein n=1 Tax=Cryobacterium cheniae TaxID=1259262 RepID=UPI0018E0A894|nr:hypothetical protein [Cryobacterium cheniae]
MADSPRDYFFYLSDDGDILAIRMGDYKTVLMGQRATRLMEQRATRLMAWAKPFVKLRVPRIFSLRQDPFERADENSNTYWDRVLDHA